jgi:hypothetical protein
VLPPSSVAVLTSDFVPQANARLKGLEADLNLTGVQFVSIC